ncbi:MAG: arginine N-succinyltransferase [bacterium]
MFLLREVRPSDLDDLYELAKRLNTLNLPANRDVLKKRIDYSRASFGGRFEDPSECEYIFVLRDLEADQVIGTCMIIAKHGTFERPAVYFKVNEVQKYSTTISRHFVHQTLQLHFDYRGPTEIGGLILHPDYRGHRLKLGKLLSYVRFLYIGMHKDRFEDELVAELLPELSSDGTSELWEHLGRHFTGLDYMTADKMSRENIEFIRSLFPFEPLYTSMLPKDVEEKIGKVGPPTQPVEKMLKSIGFTYDHSIDPFDGGPTFRARTQNCEPIQRTTQETFVGILPDDEPADGLAMVGYEYDTKLVRFRAAMGEYRRVADGVQFRSVAAEKLRVEPGEVVGFLPLSGPGLINLY